MARFLTRIGAPAVLAALAAFGTAAAQYDERGRQDRGGQAQQTRQVTGQIQRTKKVDVRGTDNPHLVVLLETQEGRRLVVDLGPVRRLRDIQVRSGERITAQGRVVRVRDKTVLMADQVRADGQTVRIDRRMGQRGADRYAAGRIDLDERGPAGRFDDRDRAGQARTGQGQVRGQIEQLRRARVRRTGTENWVVVLRTEGGRRLLVDLGPRTDLARARLEEGNWLVVQGRQVRIGDRPILMATRVLLDGRAVSIDREDQFRAGTMATRR